MFKIIFCPLAHVVALKLIQRRTRQVIIWIILGRSISFTVLNFVSSYAIFWLMAFKTSTEAAVSL